MSSYLLRRAGTSIIIMIGLSLLIFAMLHWIGGAPGRAVLGLKAFPAAVNAWNRQHGYDRPFIVQFLSYDWQLLHGNLGYSYKLNETVAAVLAQRAPISIYLSGLALVISIVIAFPLGIYQAVRRNSFGDNVATTAAFVFYSFPTFLLALLLIQVFALSWGIFPVGSSAAVSQDSSLVGAIEDPRAMVLPVVTLVLVNIAGYSRYMRSSALDALAQDYIKAAKAKGLPERLVLWRHLVRNASLPMITLIGLSIPLLLAGNLIVEYVFNYPGLGVMFFNALTQEDYPILMAYTLVGGVLTVVGNYIADIALTVADPRIRLA